MSDVPDIKLLIQFARNKSEAAFSELVKRHIGLVYSTAFRKTGNPQQAEDVTQAVFITLARKANSLGPKTVLPGWLHHTARLTAANLQRAELRRIRREHEAFMQSTTHETAPDALWRELSPLLDDAVADLRASDRDAIVLRFFQNRSLAEVGATLGASEDATRMRVNRALEKMRKFFVQRGVTISSTAIAGTLSANSAHAVPAGLAAIISANVISGTTITSAATAAATKALAMTTFQKAIVTAALVATAGAGIFEVHQNSESQKQIQNLQQQQNSFNEQIAQLQRERDEAANQVTGLLAENAQLKSNSNQNELLNLRGRVTALQAAAEATGKTQGSRNGADPSQMDRDAQRSQTRANLNTFFKLANMSPDKAEQYVDLEVEMRRRQDERLAGLLQGTLSVADAVRQRDQDSQAQQDQRRELLGPDGWAVLQSVADGMRDSAAKILIGTIKANMGNNSLTQEQSDRLQSLIKVEVAANTMDDTDLFRPVDEWTRMIAEHEQRVLQGATEFLTPAQQQTLQFLEEENLKLMLLKRDQRRQAIGVKP
jgi:RNA polymerase sigma factor (sigma-70 family)